MSAQPQARLTVCRINCVDCRIALAEIYAKVTLGAEDLIPPRPPVT